MSPLLFQLAERQGQYQKACAEIDDVTETLTKTVSVVQCSFCSRNDPLSLFQAESQFKKYGELMVKFGLDLYKDKKD